MERRNVFSSDWQFRSRIDFGGDCHERSWNYFKRTFRHHASVNCNSSSTLWIGVDGYLMWIFISNVNATLISSVGNTNGCVRLLGQIIAVLLGLLCTQTHTTSHATSHTMHRQHRLFIIVNRFSINIDCMLNCDLFHIGARTRLLFVCDYVYEWDDSLSFRIRLSIYSFCVTP